MSSVEVLVVGVLGTVHTQEPCLWGTLSLKAPRPCGPQLRLPISSSQRWSYRLPEATAPIPGAPGQWVASAGGALGRGRRLGFFRTDSSVQAKKSLAFLTITPHKKQLLKFESTEMLSSQGAGVAVGGPLCSWGASGCVCRCEHAHAEGGSARAPVCACAWTCTCGESCGRSTEPQRITVME